MSVHIGTSGWHYRHWLGRFYPRDLSPESMLDYYARRFCSVEINSSFYRLPETETLVAWRHSTPDRFVFAFKANRYITHMKKLSESAQALEKMVARARVLGDKLGPLLFQLPPKWRSDSERLEAFLRKVPADIRVAFEFRDPSWFTDRVYESLRRHEAAFCIYDLGGQTSPNETTAGFVYIRLHGPTRAYQGSYSARDLSRWAEAIATWDRSGKDVYCFFDNDECGYAAQNAGELTDMLA